MSVIVDTKLLRERGMLAITAYDEHTAEMVGWALDELDRLREQNAKLIEALRPFAKQGAQFRCTDACDTHRPHRAAARVLKEIEDDR